MAIFLKDTIVSFRICCNEILESSFSNLISQKYESRNGGEFREQG